MVLDSTHLKLNTIVATFSSLQNAPIEVLMTLRFFIDSLKFTAGWPTFEMMFAYPTQTTNYWVLCFNSSVCLLCCIMDKGENLCCIGPFRVSHSRLLGGEATISENEQRRNWGWWFLKGEVQNLPPRTYAYWGVTRSRFVTQNCMVTLPFVRKVIYTDVSAHRRDVILAANF